MNEEYEQNIARLENELYDGEKQIIFLKNQIMNIDNNRPTALVEKKLKWRESQK
jgi:hypothetical protein